MNARAVVEIKPDTSVVKYVATFVVRWSPIIIPPEPRLIPPLSFQASATVAPGYCCHSVITFCKDIYFYTKYTICLW